MLGEASNIHNGIMNSSDEESSNRDRLQLTGAQSEESSESDGEQAIQLALFQSLSAALQNHNLRNETETENTQMATAPIEPVAAEPERNALMPVDNIPDNQDDVGLGNNAFG